MNPTAIFSKSGKGVQEASGKTSSLSRGDRAVLSAIDGRVTLAEVAQKVGKTFDKDFEGLIVKLDKDGFIREVSPGAAVAGKPAAAPSKPAAGKPTAPMEAASDLDFTATIAVPARKPGGAPPPPPQAVSRAPAPPPKPANVPPPPPPPSAAEKAKQAEIAKQQQSAFARAREEAEQKAQEQRDRVKSEAEAKIRAETEAKMRAEAEQKMKSEAEARAKKAEADAAAARSAAIRAAAEAKVRAEQEAKRAREEAERAKREAEEKAERARKEAEERVRQEAERARREAEEKARREQEELKRKLEEERRAREEAERKAKEEAERARRELEEERRKLEEERKAREEQQRREDDERRLQRELQEQQEEAGRTARQKQREEEEERERTAREEQSRAAKAAETAAPPPAPKAKPPATGDAFADSLLADLDSFTQKDDEDRKAKEEAERKAKEEVARKQREEAERQESEAAEIRERMEAERRRKEEEAQRARDAEEARASRIREEQEQAAREIEERQRKVGAAAPAAGGDDIGITDEDLDLDEVKREQALLDKKKNRKEDREKEREKERAQKAERDREAKSKKAKEREEKETKKAAAYRPRRKSHLGRNLFLGLIVLIAIGVGVAHVLPVDTADYERAGTEALGVPVKIAAGHFSMIGGVQYRFDGVTIGSISVPTVRAYPELGSLFDDKKVFTRVELEGMTLPQSSLGGVLFAREHSDNLKVSRLTLKSLKLSGALPLPPLDADLQLEGGAVRAATLRGPEGLVAKLETKGGNAIQFDVNTAQFTLPFAQGITIVQFAMKGDATRQGMKIAQWDGLLFSGQVTGTASVRWGDTWNVEGVMTARGVNAAVFAPALVSDGRADGTGRFSMSGVEPAKLHAGARLEGNFTVQKGVLGSFDLGKALQTNGRQTNGQTQFAEMSGQGVYERGTVSLRNINLGAGALNAGASAEVDEKGGLSGRIVADVKTSTQNLRATLILGGTVQEPQVRN
jgi:hypothetical protein